MSKEVGKSPEMLQKEAKVRELQTILKKRKSVLKSLKTRLSNNKKEIEEVQFKTSSHFMGIFDRLDELRQEIAELANKLKKLKSLSKMDREALGEMADELTDASLFGEQFQAYQQHKQEHLNQDFDFAEETRAKMRDIFKEFQVKPDEKEQKDIRKVFVKLSNKFHPDRARNEKEAAEFHKMQQRLNDAYQSGDIHTLLEMERLYMMEEIDLSEAKAYTVDVLQNAIEKLEKELQFIENQITRYQQEIKSLRSSDFGSMLTHLKKAKKEGFGLEDELAIMEKNLEMLTELRDALRMSLEKEDISPMMDLVNKPMMAGGGEQMPFDPDMSPEEALAYLDQLLNGGKGDLMDRINEVVAQAHDEAKFSPDQTVKIKSTLVHPANKKVELKGAVGRVLDIEFDHKGRLVYDLTLDSVFLKSLPKEFISNCVQNGYDFETVTLFEKDLRACPPRDTHEESIASYRTLFNQYNWDHLEPSQEKKMLEILLTIPEKNDEENWDYYLRKQLKYPFEAIIRGMMDNPPGTKMTVRGIDSIHEEDGFIMKVKVGKYYQKYPLFDLEAPEQQSELYDLLEIYSEWQGYYYDLDDLDDGFFF